MAERLVYGAPFKGYVASIPKHRAPMNSMTGDSQDCVMDPLSGAIERRGGMKIQGDTYVSHEVSGLLDASWQARSRRLFAMRSDSLTDGYETYASLYTRETHPNGGTFPAQDDGYFGQVYVRNTNAGATLQNYRMGDEFSTTHYPTKGGTYNSVHHMVWVPLWYESGEGGYTRGAFPFARRFIAAGARSVLDTGGKLYIPSLRATPCKWNKRFNSATGSGSETNRLWPSGSSPNAAAPIAGTPTAVSVGGNDAVWGDGDTYVISVIGRRKDGSYTLPTQARLPNTNLPAGLALVVVGTPGGGAQYAAMTYAVPIFDDDVDARLILRSRKSTRATTATAIGVDIGTLYICGVLRNNTQTQFVDTNGNDLGLLQDNNIVRLDHVPPRRSRFIGTGDQRALLGYTLPSQKAIVIAPTGSTTNWAVGAQALNAPDTSALIFGNQVMLLRISETQLQINRYDVAGPTLFTASVTLSGNTLQDVCDLINATAASGADEGQWRAQLAEGIDGTLPATNLCPTSWGRTCSGTSGNNYITCDTPGDFANIPLGYKWSGSGSIPADTIIIRKDGDKAYLGNESGTAVVLTGNIASVALTIYADLGDGTAYHATNRGYARVFSPSYYFMAYVRRSTLAGYDSPDKQSSYFTVSSPGAATSGVSLAPEAFVAGNRRATDSRLGIHQGFVDVEGAAACGFSKGLRFFINVRGVNSGEDFDYRIMTVEDGGGVIDDKGFVGGRGWASYPNDEGYFAIDKNRSPKRLSGDIHNFDNPNLSSLAFELALCRDAVDSDKDTNAFHAAITGSVLHVTYRTTAVSWSQRRQTYHFAPGIEAAGLEELIDPESRQPYGWGAPCFQPLSCICEVSTAAGRLRLATIDTNAGVADGRIDSIDTTDTTDNGEPYTPVAYLAASIPGWFQRWSALRVEVLHSSPDGSAPTLRHHRLMDRSSYSDATPEKLNEDPAREIFDFTGEAKSNGDVAEPAWFFSDVDGEKLYGMCVEAELADAY